MGNRILIYFWLVVFDFLFLFLWFNVRMYRTTKVEDILWYNWNKWNRAFFRLLVLYILYLQLYVYKLDNCIRFVSKCRESSFPHYCNKKNNKRLWLEKKKLQFQYRVILYYQYMDFLYGVFLWQIPNLIFFMQRCSRNTFQSE